MNGRPIAVAAAAAAAAAAELCDKDGCSNVLEDSVDRSNVGGVEDFNGSMADVWAGLNDVDEITSRMGSRAGGGDQTSAEGLMGDSNRK